MADHHHGYAISQLRSRTLLTMQCANMFCGEVVLSAYGWLVVALAVATVLVLACAVLA